MMDNKSRMSREAHVRFCEKLGLKCPGLLDCSNLRNHLIQGFPTPTTELS